MNKHGIDSVLVSKNSNIIGIITESDIFGKVIAKNKLPSTIFVQEIMSSPLEAIDKDAPADEASAKMSEKGVKRLLVVKGNKPVGIVTISDLVKKTITVQKPKFEGWAKNVSDAWNAF